MRLEDLKRNRAASTQALAEQLEQSQGRGPSPREEEDEGLWKPQRGKDGNGYAVIRFLQAPKVDYHSVEEPGVPYVRLWNHFFQGPGGWYIENSRTSLGRGEPDPASELNVQLYNSGIKSDQDQAKRQKRKLNFYSNIYVISDPANPENEGKVFLFKYGKRIFDKIDDMMNPKFPDEPRVNVFDFWDGADFKMKISTQEMTINGKKRQMPNYDKSEFAAPSPLLGGDDDALNDIWDQCVSLKDLVSPDKFKSYDALKARLDKVIGGTPAPAPAPAPKREEPVIPEAADDDIPFDVEPAPKASSMDDDDDDLSFFKSLAEED